MTHFNLIRHFHETLPAQSMASEEIAVVDVAIAPGAAGRVRYRGTYWFGVCQQPRLLPKGTAVIVIGRNGNTLMVEPVLTCQLERSELKGAPADV